MTAHPPDPHPLDPHPLDNVIWAALGGHQADLAHADRRPLAARYQTDVAWFAAVADLSEAAGADLASQCAAGEVAILFRDRVPSALAGFDEVHREQVHQMIAPISVRPDLSRSGLDPADIEPLGPADTDEMLALTDLTKPGPFLPGTARMGDFFGIRHDGALVAMAGTRFATDTWCEVSAVCTHPDARGRGYGATLTEWITARIQASGRQAFLHVTATNTSAKALYDKLGFRERREVTVAAFIRSA